MSIFCDDPGALAGRMRHATCVSALLRPGSLAQGRSRGSAMPTNVDWHEIGPLVAAGGQLVDVLPYKEYEQSHLPDALNIPLKGLDGKTTRVLRRDRPAIVYCYDRQ